LNISKNNFTDQIKNIWNSNTIPTSNNFSNSSDLISDKNTIDLNEVTIIEKKKKEKEDFREVDKLLLSRSKTTVVDKDIALTYPTIADLIRNRGFTIFVSSELRQDNRVQIRRNGGLNTFLAAGEDPPPPLVFVDDVRISDFNFLLEIPTSSVKSLFVDKNGYTDGIRGANGVIRIYTRYDQLFLGNDASTKRKNAYEYTFKNGFEKTKQFYAPKYVSYASKAFEDFGVIHWEPEAITNQNGEVSFKILNTRLKNIVFFIEGMDANGNLISSKEIIQML